MYILSLCLNMKRLSVQKFWTISCLEWTKNSNSILKDSLRYFLSDSHNLEQILGWILIFCIYVLRFSLSCTDDDPFIEPYLDKGFWKPRQFFSALKRSLGKLSAIETKLISDSLSLENLNSPLFEVIWSIILSNTSKVYFHRMILSSRPWRDKNKFWFCFKF